MSTTLKCIQDLAAKGDAVVSVHAYDEMANDGISTDDVMARLSEAVVIEDYPDATRGPSVLALQLDPSGRPLHVVWGIPKDKNGPAVVITAYRPDPSRWSDDYTRRQ